MITFDISVSFILEKIQIVEYCRYVDSTKGQNMTIENKLLTVPELSEYLGIAIETLKKYRMRGTGPKFIKLGRLVRYRLSDVDEWVAEITKEKEYEV